MNFLISFTVNLSYRFLLEFLHKLVILHQSKTKGHIGRFPLISLPTSSGKGSLEPSLEFKGASLRNHPSTHTGKSSSKSPLVASMLVFGGGRIHFSRSNSFEIFFFDTFFSMKGKACLNFRSVNIRRQIDSLFNSASEKVIQDKPTDWWVMMANQVAVLEAKEGERVSFPDYPNERCILRPTH